MRIKKKIATILAVCMLFNAVPISLLANEQQGLSTDKEEGIRAVIIDHKEDMTLGEGNILPKINVEWSPAPDNTWSSLDTDTTKRPKGYRFELTDIINGSFKMSDNSVKEKDGVTTYSEQIQEYYTNTESFKNGTLYKLRIIPYHFHSEKNGSAPIRKEPSNSVEQPVKYFVSDFNTQVKDNDSKLEISWEYIQGGKYELLYTAGNVSSKKEMLNPDGSLKTGTIRKEITESDVTIKNNRVIYSVPDANLGQLYSACVILTGITNNKVPVTIEYIERNIDNPKIAQASTSVPLKVFNTSKDKIRLEWTLGDWMLMGGALEKTQIKERLKDGEEDIIGTINNTGVDPGYYSYREPSKGAWYKVVFTVRQGNKTFEIETKEVYSAPEALKQKPLQPQIPKPFSVSMDISKLDNIKDYLVKSDDIDKTSPLLINNTFHAKRDNELSIQLVWNTQNKVDENKVDFDLEYDLWVTEKANQIVDYDEVAPIEIIKINENEKDYIIYKQDGKTPIGFKYDFTQYISNQGSKEALKSNQSYYIHLRAKRAYGTDIYAKSDVTIVMITLDKDGDISSPPVISKPPLELDAVTQTTATLKWLESWYEIMPKTTDLYANEEKNLEKMWHARLYLTNTVPYIRLITQSGISPTVLKQQKDVQDVRAYVNKQQDGYYDKNFADRRVTLGSDVKYEVKTILYSDIIKEIGITTTPSAMTLENWIVENESNLTIGWQEAAPESIKDNGLPAKKYIVQNLTPNTRYVILIRAYRIDSNGNKLEQAFPSYVIATTDTNFESLEPIPVTPVLKPNGSGHEWISVYWKNDEQFDYIIKYNSIEDFNTAQTWPVEISNIPGDKNYVPHNGKASVTITGLSPETTYYVWIQAKQKIGPNISAPSNACPMETKSIDTPDIPKGLGPASQESILKLGKDFSAVDSNYITVEWIKNIGDDEKLLSTNKVYKYIIEMADNPEFMDALVVDTSGEQAEGAEILDKTMVRFTGLEANMPYYVRVKAVVTYMNAVTGKTIVKESEFTSYVRIFTKTSNDEYDGGENDNIVIYPNAIEETYQNGIWTYEIVDAAKITTQIQWQKQYFYTITLENYKNRYDASIRRIKMPKKVLDTLINQNMALRIVTNIGTYEIPGKALKYYSNQYSAIDIVQFDLTRMMYSDIYNYMRSYPEQYENGEKLEIAIKGSKINKLDDYMTVKLKLDVVGSYNYSNFFTYQYNYAAGNWNKYNYAIDTVDNSYLTYSTVYTGLNAIYERSVLGSNSNASYVMNELTSAYNITGLGTTYGKNSHVGASQYVSLILGIRLNRNPINLVTGATSDDYEKAKAAGLYISSSRGNVTKEQALAGMIKLYEINHGYQIKPSNSTFNNVSMTYREAASKAYAIGLIDSIENPQSIITYEALCDWMIQVIQ